MRVMMLSNPGSCTWAKQGEYLDFISNNAPQYSFIGETEQ